MSPDRSATALQTEPAARRAGDPLAETAPLPLGVRVQRLLHSRPLLGPTAVLVGSVLVFTAIVGPAFLQPGNISLVLQQVQIIGMLGVAQTLIVLTAGIDLSVAAIMVLTTVVAGKLSVEHGVPGGVALVIALITGLACGLVNGALVSRFRIPPFITTLGTLSVFTALTIWLSDSQTIRGQDLPALLLWPGQTFTVLGARITYGSVLMVLTVIGVAIVLRRTAWGEHVYMVGDNAEGARLTGIRTSRVPVSYTHLTLPTNSRV